MANSQPLFRPESSAAVAWLFPGQGAHVVGMGHDLWDASPAARQVFETADCVLGYSLTEVCFKGPEERLRETEFAQPAIMAAGLACLAAGLESGVIRDRPAFVAGHSLGECSALVAAGALSLEDGLRLVQKRARLMAEASAAHPGTLAAILGLDEATVTAICREAGVDPCNLNLPSQTVIGGSREGVARAMALAKAKGAQRIIELNVSGAFHSRLMASAVPGLIAVVAAAQIRSPEVPVVANVSGEVLGDAASVREELGIQIARPVRWHASVTLMARAGVSTFVEFGPGRVLTGLVKRLVPGANLINIGTMQDAAARGSAVTTPA